MKKSMVKLNDGSKVPLEEFVTWHHAKQHRFTISTEEKKTIYAKSGAKLQRAVNTPMGQFPSFGTATQALGITDVVLRKYIRNTALPLYSYVEPTSEDISKQFHKVLTAGKKKTITPIGTFDTRISASKALGIEDHQLKRLIKEYPEQYYYSVDNTNVGKRKARDGIKKLPIKKYKFISKIVTPLGDFLTRKDAALALSKTPEQFENLMLTLPSKYYIKKNRIKL